MNRLQKKCIVGTAGIHLLLLTILIFGPAFFNRQPKTDNTILDVIPSTAVDIALNQGVRDAQAPPPAPAPAVIPPSLLQPPPPPAPTPEPKVVEPQQPAPTPSPSLLEQFEKMFKPAKPTPPTPTVTPDLKPVKKTEKSHADNIKIDLTKVTRANHSHNSNPDNNAKAINSALRSLKTSLSASTKIDMPGTGSAAMANYATVVKSVYEQALRPHVPGQVASNNECTKVSVTIAKDGTVISSDIISRSGDSAWDDAVQTTLNEVASIGTSFPTGVTENERRYILSFNPDIEKSF
ncbi:MAG TPA: TonB C-terminal domain-containing protein [Verrucomicrobiae bacterium]|jgi:outer membrane biosynthesis protein TonB|nr:TonB C-terminal domain-containing protein [Verrucomicrobiae bacterium]